MTEYWYILNKKKLKYFIWIYFTNIVIIINQPKQEWFELFKNCSKNDSQNKIL